MNEKKEILVDKILRACERVTKEPFTNEKKVSFERFIRNRLRLHGEKYVFYTVHDHHRVYLDLKPAWAIEVVAEYTLKINK